MFLIEKPIPATRAKPSKMNQTLNRVSPVATVVVSVESVVCVDVDVDVEVDVDVYATVYVEKYLV